MTYQEPVPDEHAAFYVEIPGENILSTPALVEEAGRRAVENGSVSVLMRHPEEPYLVRGRNEPLVYSDDEAYGDSWRDRVIRRSDGGGTFDHSNTGCLMVATTVEPQDFRSVQSYMAGWQDYVTALVNTHSPREIGPGTSVGAGRNPVDIYDAETREQVVGMSGVNARFSSGQDVGFVRIYRACWYNEEPAQDLDDMVRADARDRLDARENLPYAGPEEYMEAFRASFRPVEPDLIDLLEHGRIAVEPEEFITEENIRIAERLQNQDSASKRNIPRCVMS